MADNQEYENFLNLLKKRTSVRRFKPDPIPEGTIAKVLEAGRWAMSGANSQPWEFIVVEDAKIKEELYQAYLNINSRFSFWMEQQRTFELRHPAHQISGAPEEQLKVMMGRRGWSNAPVLIVVVGDGRKQWGTVLAGHTFGRGLTHFTDSLANACQLIHLAVASLGLGSQWVTIHIQDPFKRILKVPDTHTIHIIIPIGYPAVERKAGYRFEVASVTHRNTYDMSKYLPDEKFIDFLRELRKSTTPHYRLGREGGVKE